MRIIDLVSESVGTSVALLYLMVFAVTVFDVAMRYVFDSPTVWGLELVVAIAGIQYVLGGAQAIKNDAHVRIDVVYDQLPARVRRVMDVVAAALMTAFLLVVAYFGWEQAAPSLARGETSGAGWNSHAPMYMKLAIPVGAALMAAQAFVQLARAVARLGRQPESHHVR